VDSLIPLLYLQEGSLQGAVDKAMSILHASVASFEVCSQKLLARNAHDAKVQRQVQQFIDSCKYACTGNINWRSVSPPWRLKRAFLTNIST
jgi:hypothetical protein